MRTFTHCKLELDLAAVKQNLLGIRAHVNTSPARAGRCRVCAVLKANAYGHGALPVARALEKAGADAFAVATLGEAASLRRGGILAPILILGETPPASARRLLALDLLQTVHTLSYAEALSRAAQRAGGRVAVHLKLDTGMSRLGFSQREQEDALRASCLSGLLPCGVFSHLSSADEAWGREESERQLSLFLKMAEAIEAQAGPLCRHIANSAGLLLSPAYHLDMVRPGLLLYGVSPSPLLPLPFPLSPAMRLLGRITQLKRLAPSDRVGYGGTFTGAFGYLATVTGGYADGFPRYDGNGPPPLVECLGRAYPLAGRVSMDRMSVYLGETPLPEGSEVTLLGGMLTPLSALASALGRSPYEILCHIGRRKK